MKTSEAVSQKTIRAALFRLREDPRSSDLFKNELVDVLEFLVRCVNEQEQRIKALEAALGVNKKVAINWERLSREMAKRGKEVGLEEQGGDEDAGRIDG